MAELKDLVQFALDKQPSKFKDAFSELVAQRVVNKVDELKSEISANMFGEAPEEEDDFEDLDDTDDEDLDVLDDEDLDGLIDFDDEDMPSDDEDSDVDFDLDDEDVDFDDEDIDENSSFNEEDPAIKEGLRNFVKKVGGKIRQGMENDIARADDSRAAKARDKENSEILKKHYGTSNLNKIYKMRSHSIKSGRGDI